MTNLAESVEWPVTLRGSSSGSERAGSASAAVVAASLRSSAVAWPDCR